MWEEVPAPLDEIEVLAMPQALKAEDWANDSKATVMHHRDADLSINCLFESLT